MGDAAYARGNFSGGEISKFAQGRFDRETYPTCLNVCRNMLVLETGGLTRRPGTMNQGVSRGGAAARVVEFQFKASSPYTVEFTDGYARFRSNSQLAMTNDQVSVLDISSANPAVVQTSAAHGWSSGNTVYLNTLGATCPSLHNRPFTITVTDATHFSIADAVTGASIDGSAIGTFVAGNVTRVLEVTTPYVGGAWATLRMIKADVPIATGTTPGAVILHAAIKPYVLQVSAAPTSTTFATFSLAAATFKDGPYFDEFTSGVLASPSAKIGNINLTLSFNAYDSTRSYTIGDYVTSAGVNYKSLTDANLNNTPAGSPSNWVAVSGADPIGPNGFQGTDIGRHVRLYSEPQIWLASSTYAAKDVVAYGGSGFSYTGATYWQSLVGSNTGNTPGTDLTKWALFPQGALWSWGKIVSLLNEIDRTAGTNIGDMTAGGGLAAAFDGVISKVASASAEKSAASTKTISGYVGKNYTAVAAQKIQQATYYPPSDETSGVGTIRVKLRGKATAPGGATPWSDGTLLSDSGDQTNSTSPITVVSSDQTTTWNYFWLEIIFTIHGAPTTLVIAAAQAKFFNPPGTGTSAGVVVQILGDALLYTTAIRRWRIGLYSDTTGWPTCGTYHEGRLWLSGVVNNRIDASKSNDVFNFAPTDATGAVGNANAISYTFNAADVNTILWMEPDPLGIVCGTAAGEWLVQSSQLSNPLTPTSMQAKRTTKHKCANIEPRRTGLTLAVVQAFARSVLEFFQDVYSGKFAADNLAEDAYHLTAGNIAELAYQQQLAPIIWARRADGTLVGTTYRRRTLNSSQKAELRAWHGHSLGSGRTVEYICNAASVGGTLDTVAMVTSDGSVRHVEALTEIPEEGATLAQAWYLDNAINPDATATSNVTPSPYGGLTLYGLWPHVGKTVAAWIGGLDCGDHTVASDGTITVPYGDSVSAGTANGQFTAAFAAGLSLSQMVVGFAYESRWQLVRPNAPAESGARNGPALGKLRNNAYYSLLVEGAVAGTINIGTDFTKMYPANFKAANQTGLLVNQPFSGVHRDVIDSADDFDGMLAGKVTRPYPANVQAFGAPRIETKDI